MFQFTHEGSVMCWGSEPGGCRWSPGSRRLRASQPEHRPLCHHLPSVDIRQSGRWGPQQLQAHTAASAPLCESLWAVHKQVEEVTRTRQGVGGLNKQAAQVGRARPLVSSV